MLPVVGSEDDRDYARLPVLITLYGALDFATRALLQGKVVGADEQKDDARVIQGLLALGVNIVSSLHQPLMPDANQSFALQRRELDGESLA